jgi:hypothetical protein
MLAPSMLLQGEMSTGLQTSTLTWLGLMLWMAHLIGNVPLSFEVLVIDFRFTGSDGPTMATTKPRMEVAISVSPLETKPMLAIQPAKATLLVNFDSFLEHTYANVLSAVSPWFSTHVGSEVPYSKGW